MLITFILFLVIGALGKKCISLYNGLIGLRMQLERNWSNIEVILKQRFDEIPQLIEVIEQFAQYESDVLERVIKARTHYTKSRNVDDKIAASQEMTAAFKGILAIGEAYPELKSNQQFVQLQTRISQLENTLSDRRETYNEIVAIFNTRIEQFPDVFAARVLNYRRQKMFEVSDAEKINPNLKMKLPKRKRA